MIYTRWFPPFNCTLLYSIAWYNCSYCRRLHFHWIFVSLTWVLVRFHSAQFIFSFSLRILLLCKRNIPLLVFIEIKILFFFVYRGGRLCLSNTVFNFMFFFVLLENSKSCWMLTERRRYFTRCTRSAKFLNTPLAAKHLVYYYFG